VVGTVVSGLLLGILGARILGGLVAELEGWRVIMLVGALTMFVFTLFWTSLTFLLSAAPCHYGSFAIGLFGLAGLLGAAAAQGGGRLHDRGHDHAGTIVAWLLVLVAFGFCALGGHSLIWLLLGTVLFDLAIQTQRILNQSQAFALAPSSRSRVNTAYIAGDFIGAACGSLLATALWALDRWPAITSAGACTALVALAISALRALPRRRARPAPATRGG
jgi:predicted MFS family arabinose efflux permease